MAARQGKGSGTGWARSIQVRVLSPKATRPAKPAARAFRARPEPITGVMVLLPRAWRYTWPNETPTQNLTVGVASWAGLSDFFHGLGGQPPRSIGQPPRSIRQLAQKGNGPYPKAAKLGPEGPLDWRCSVCPGSPAAPQPDPLLLAGPAPARLTGQSSHECRQALQEPWLWPSTRPVPVPGCDCQGHTAKAQRVDP